MMIRLSLLVLFSLSVACVGAKEARFPTMEVRYMALSDGKNDERSREREHLNATLISGAQLPYKKAVDLLRAAETPEGGSPQKLLRAGRTLTPGEGVVLLGTVRREASGGSATTVSVFQLAVQCASASVDSPGELKDCNGYVMRVPKTWPAEVYDLTGVTISILPEGGSARGRMNAKSTPSNFTIEMDGEFTASLAEFSAAAAP